MIYMVDIDGTICEWMKDGDYSKAVPWYSRIEKINKLYDEGHTIHYWTARGMTSHTNWEEVTKKQLFDWGCKYHTVNFKKPAYDVWIDDKAFSNKEFFGDTYNG